MKDSAVYISTQGSANKFWRYQISPDNTVRCNWGRLGLEAEKFEDTIPSRRSEESFGSRYAAEAFVDKKLRPKTQKKGYTEKTNKELKQESKTGQGMGFRNKIKRMQWVRKVGKKLKHLIEYDPNQWVYVEIINSWTKEITYLLLSKDKSYGLTGVSESGNTITYANLPPAPRSLADAVRGVLRKLSKAVQKIVTIKLADMGVRNLGLTDEPVSFSETEFEEISEAVGDDSAFDGVINTLAALGVRKLDL